MEIKDKHTVPTTINAQSIFASIRTQCNIPSINGMKNLQHHIPSTFKIVCDNLRKKDPMC